MDDKKIKLSEVAKHFGVSYSTINEWTKKGLPYSIERKIGLKPRMVVSLKDAYKWLDMEEISR